MAKVLPTFSLERRLWNGGCKLVIGVDEVGRGALAGPVTAAVVAFSQKEFSKIRGFGINDSKRLAPKQRKSLAALIKDCCFDYAISSESVATINRIGIVKATERAMRKSVASVKKKENQDGKTFVLVDGRHVRYIPGVGLKNQKNIYGGDRKSISIAAASILAKVHRDGLMKKLAENRRYRKYGWDKNKGYGTESHIKAIKRYGLTRLHREQFVRKISIWSYEAPRCFQEQVF